MDAVETEKKALREQIARTRHQLDAAWIAEKSARIQRSALTLDAVSSARGMACYIALPREVQTASLLEECRRNGTRTCVPAWSHGDQLYELAWIDDERALAAGPCGIPQPSVVVRPEKGEIDAIVVPGVAFDADGNRLGHGGGHYDRIVTTQPLCSALRIGLSFSFQLVDSVPACGHDAPVDIVVTEDKILMCKRREQ